MQGIILIWNAPRQSVYNPIKRVIGHIGFTLQGIVAMRELIEIVGMEDEIKRLGLIKEFYNKYKENK